MCVQTSIRTVYRRCHSALRPHPESFAALPFYFFQLHSGNPYLNFLTPFHPQQAWEEGLASFFPDQPCLERSGWNYLIWQISPKLEH